VWKSIRLNGFATNFKNRKHSLPCIRLYSQTLGCSRRRVYKAPALVFSNKNHKSMERSFLVGRSSFHPENFVTSAISNDGFCPMLFVLTRCELSDNYEIFHVNHRFVAQNRQPPISFLAQPYPFCLNLPLSMTQFYIIVFPLMRIFP